MPKWCTKFVKAQLLLNFLSISTSCNKSVTVCLCVFLLYFITHRRNNIMYTYPVCTSGIVQKTTEETLQDPN